MGSDALYSEVMSIYNYIRVGNDALYARVMSITTLEYGVMSIINLEWRVMLYTQE